MTKVIISNAAKEIEVNPGETILEAALAQGLPFPHGCGQGRCGACKSHVLSGEVELKTPFSRFALTAEERSRAIVLACRAFPKGPVEIAWGETEDFKSESTASRADMNENVPTLSQSAEVTELTWVTNTVARLRLRPNARLPFRAGQFALLRFGELPARSYSMANVPEDEILEFHIRHVPGGRVTSYVRENVRTGDTVLVEGPFGEAYLRSKGASRIVCIGGGTGLAPMQAIVQKALELNVFTDVRLYHGVRSSDDSYHTLMFDALAKRHPHFRFQTKVGRLDDLLERERAFDADTTVYLAGRTEMVDALRQSAVRSGVEPTRIHADSFG